MTLEEILETWDSDSVHDPIELGAGALHVARLHAKYLRMLSLEKIRLYRLEQEGKQLRLQKSEYFQGHDQEEFRAKGWQMPIIGKIKVATLLTQYLDADQDIVDHNIIVVSKRLCVEALDLIMKSIQYRTKEIEIKQKELIFKSGR